MTRIGEIWICCNNIGIQWIHNIQWDVQGLENLQADKSYFVIANHQSWVDIVILQKIFFKRIPFLRFFIKKELVYVPFLGGAWWGLDFPRMHRYSREYLSKHPEKRGLDLRATREACEKFRGSPVSIFNFLEGTRWTAEKHRKSHSQFKHLLPPKIGGLSFVLQSMGDQFDSILDVSIVYPNGLISLWGLLSGKLDRVIVRVQKVPIPPWMLQNKSERIPGSREKSQQWLFDLWNSKDILIDNLLNKKI